MIARRQWSTLPATDSINLEGTMAMIKVDVEALEKLLRGIQCAIEPAVGACKYDKVIELIICYKDLEEVLMALKEEKHHDETNG